MCALKIIRSAAMALITFFRGMRWLCIKMLLERAQTRAKAACPLHVAKYGARLVAVVAAERHSKARLSKRKSRSKKRMQLAEKRQV